MKKYVDWFFIVCCILLVKAVAYRHIRCAEFTDTRCLWINVFSMETGKPFTIEKKINLETGQTIKTIVMHSELRVSRTNTSRCVCVIFICCLFYSVCVWCFDMIFFRFTLCICRISLHTISFIFIINASFFNKQNRYILAKHYYWQLTHVAGQTKQNISYAANNFLSIKCMRLRTFWLVVQFYSHSMHVYYI